MADGDDVDAAGGVCPPVGPTRSLSTGDGAGSAGGGRVDGRGVAADVESGVAPLLHGGETLHGETEDGGDA